MFSIKNYFLIVFILIIFICQFKVFEAVGRGKADDKTMDEILSKLAAADGVSNQSIKDEAKLPVYNPNLKSEILEWLNNYQLFPNFNLKYLIDSEFEHIKKIKDNNKLDEKKKIKKIKLILKTAEARANYNPYQ